MASATFHTRESASEDRTENGSGEAFEVHEWTGRGPGYLHVHYEDGEAWHVVSDLLRFRFSSGNVQNAGPGTTIYVPAARMLRFQRARMFALHSDNPNWADIAAASGYSDQAHLIRAFQEFAGEPPTVWARSARPSEPRLHV